MARGAGAIVSSCKAGRRKHRLFWPLMLCTHSDPAFIQGCLHEPHLCLCPFAGSGEELRVLAARSTTRAGRRDCMGWWPSKATTFIDNHDTGAPRHCTLECQQTPRASQASCSLDAPSLKAPCAWCVPASISSATCMRAWDLRRHAGSKLGAPVTHLRRPALRAQSMQQRQNADESGCQHLPEESPLGHHVTAMLSALY